MNILFLCDEYPPGRHGGIGTAVQLLARQMVKMGHQVVVAGFYDWGYGGEDVFDDNGVKVYRFRRGLASNVFRKVDSFFVRGAYRLLTKLGILEWDIRRSLKKYHVFLEQLIKQYKIDLVEMPDYNDYVRFCKSTIHFPKLSIPTIVKLHGSSTYISAQNRQPVSENIFQMEKSIIEQAEAVSAVSKYVAVQSAKCFGYEGSIEVLYNGIELNGIAPDLSAKDPNLVVFAGTLTENKGIYQLMKAWEIVHAEMPDARLAVVGKGPVAKVQSRLSGAALSSVTFHGHQKRTELFKIFEQAAIGVFPSFAESFGLVPIEAMERGMAVIYTKRTAGPEVIEDGVDGLLVEPSDEKEIADKIILLLKNHDLRCRLAAVGRSVVQQRFSIGSTTEKNILFYRNIITH